MDFTMSNSQKPLLQNIDILSEDYTSNEFWANKNQQWSKLDMKFDNIANKYKGSEQNIEFDIRTYKAFTDFEDFKRENEFIEIFALKHLSGEKSQLEFNENSEIDLEDSFILEEHFDSAFNVDSQFGIRSCSVVVEKLSKVPHLLQQPDGTYKYRPPESLVGVNLTKPCCITSPAVCYASKMHSNIESSFKIDSDLLDLHNKLGTANKQYSVRNLVPEVSVNKTSPEKLTDLKYYCYADSKSTSEANSKATSILDIRECFIDESDPLGFFEETGYIDNKLPLYTKMVCSYYGCLSGKFSKKKKFKTFSRIAKNYFDLSSSDVSPTSEMVQDSAVKIDKVSCIKSNLLYKKTLLDVSKESNNISSSKSQGNTKETLNKSEKELKKANHNHRTKVIDKHKDSALSCKRKLPILSNDSCYLSNFFSNIHQLSSAKEDLKTPSILDFHLDESDPLDFYNSDTSNKPPLVETYHKTFDQTTTVSENNVVKFVNLTCNNKTSEILNGDNAKANSISYFNELANIDPLGFFEDTGYVANQIALNTKVARMSSNINYDALNGRSLKKLKFSRTTNDPFFLLSPTKNVGGISVPAHESTGK